MKNVKFVKFRWVRALFFLMAGIFLASHSQATSYCAGPCCQPDYPRPPSAPGGPPSGNPSLSPGLPQFGQGSPTPQGGPLWNPAIRPVHSSLTQFQPFFPGAYPGSYNMGQMVVPALQAYPGMSLGGGYSFGGGLRLPPMGFSAFAGAALR